MSEDEKGTKAPRLDAVTKKVIRDLDLAVKRIKAEIPIAKE